MQCPSTVRRCQLGVDALSSVRLVCGLWLRLSCGLEANTDHVRSLSSSFTWWRAYIPLSHIARHERIVQESEEQSQRSGRQPEATVTPWQVIHVCISSRIRSLYSQSWYKPDTDPATAAGCDFFHLVISAEW